MINLFKDKKYWALILGGSSGIGLATAKKLAKLGMNLCIVHRDRRGAMAEINKHFDEIKATGVSFHSLNVNALTQEGRNKVIETLADTLGDGSIRLVMHSIALGNLKPAVENKSKTQTATELLAKKLNLDPDKLTDAVDSLFAEGVDELVDLASTPNFETGLVLGEEDMAQTIYNMGTNLLSWVQDIHKRNMFSKDARVIGLTSEGNQLAWQGYAAVAAAKCALESVSRAIAVEFAPYGIRSNILQPGVTDTPALKLIPGNEQMRARAANRNPHGRITTPEDVAGVVSLLVQDEAAWINGTIIRVDGGEHISG